MKAEVYGTLTLDYSMVVHNNETLAMLQSGYALDEYLVKEILVKIIGLKGQETQLRIHNWSNEPETFFGENES